MDPDARQEPDFEQTLTRLEAEVRRLQDPMEFTEPEVRAARRKLKQLIPVINSTKDGRLLTGRARRLKAELQRLAPEQVARPTPAWTPWRQRGGVLTSTATGRRVGALDHPRWPSSRPAPWRFIRAGSGRR